MFHKLFTCHFQVAYAAEQCLKQLADHLPLLGVVQVSADLFLSEDTPKNIRAATFLIQVVHKSDGFVIEESLADVLPPIVQVRTNFLNNKQTMIKSFFKKFSKFILTGIQFFA